MIQLSLSRAYQKRHKPISERKESQRQSDNSPKSSPRLDKFLESSLNHKKSSIKKKKKPKPKLPTDRLSIDSKQIFQLKQIPDIDRQSIENERIQICLPKVGDEYSKDKNLSEWMKQGKKKEKKKVLKCRSKKKRKIKTHNSPDGQRNSDLFHTSVERQKDLKDVLERIQYEEQISLGPWEENGRNTQFPFPKIQKETNHQKDQQSETPESCRKNISTRVNFEFKRNATITSPKQKFESLHVDDLRRRSKYLFTPKKLSKEFEEKMEQNQRIHACQNKNNKILFLKKVKIGHRIKRSQTSASNYIQQENGIKNVSSDRKIPEFCDQYMYFNFVRNGGNRKSELEEKREETVINMKQKMKNQQKQKVLTKIKGGEIHPFN